MPSGSGILRRSGGGSWIWKSFFKEWNGRLHVVLVSPKTVDELYADGVPVDKVASDCWTMSVRNIGRREFDAQFNRGLDCLLQSGATRSADALCLKECLLRNRRNSQPRGRTAFRDVLRLDEELANTKFLRARYIKTG